ncbi:adenylate kinase [Pantoea sp. BAV 3049]|uniref:adenylate kinase n=1 Tax=Pantoea sp. BAV 3049 TaxID=2654188 RepID=UPI00131CD701|nr:adenylate kinase [Pantoea sp. BAV 3049]
MKRVVIIGSPGAGKSTAALRLAAITRLPVIHLDQHFWSPGWVETEKSRWYEKVQALVTTPQWIMDGNYGSTLDQRLSVADTLIWLDYSSLTCLRRILMRTIKYWGKTRPDIGEGCPERFDWAFLKFALNYRRDKRRRDQQKVKAFSGKTWQFTSPKALEEFLSALASESGITPNDISDNPL